MPGERGRGQERERVGCRNYLRIPLTCCKGRDPIRRPSSVFLARSDPIENRKRKILEKFGATMEPTSRLRPAIPRAGHPAGDLVNDQAGYPPTRGLIARAMSWARSSR